MSDDLFQLEQGTSSECEPTINENLYLAYSDKPEERAGATKIYLSQSLGITPDTQINANLYASTETELSIDDKINLANEVANLMALMKEDNLCDKQAVSYIKQFVDKVCTAEINKNHTSMVDSICNSENKIMKNLTSSAHAS